MPHNDRRRPTRPPHSTATTPAHLRRAIEEERRGLRTTLRLCVQTFNQVLACPGLPDDLRAVVRSCRGLCLAGLPEGGEPRDEEH